MNDKHQGPHCAGSCEGAAYQIEIRKLRAQLDEYQRDLTDEIGVDRSQDTDWLRAGLLQRGTEIERLEAERDDHEQARTALEEVVGQMRAEADELRKALLELYRWCNNVEIRGEGLHQGPIFFAGPVFGERTQEDDHRFDALQSAEEALAAHDKEEK